jgi:cobalt/nickel transport system ATP-binding protein
MPPAVEITNLQYAYPDGTTALRGVTLRVEAGECVGLIGPNGSGKSTLLLHLNGILPDGHGADGRVLIEGLAVARENLPTIRRRVGLMFQDPDDQLFCPTVLEDVAFGPRQFGLGEAEVQHAVVEAIAAVGLTGFERRAPERLSAGEKRRACLAGVLACGPGVLALDEPTDGLDPRGRRQFKALLKQLPVTRIIATHDLEMVVELCPRVIVLDGGAIVAQGPTHELLGDEALMLAHGLERPHILLHRHPHG